MSDIVVRVRNLGKRYRIGAKQDRNRQFRDVLMGSLFAPFRKLAQAGRAPSSEETIWALRNVSFDVNRGEVIGIIGRNGAGKSTLFKILSRITSPTEGSVEIKGRVGTLLEVGTGFHPELTGRENIYLNGAILGMKKEEIGRKFDEIVAFAEIDRFLDTPVKHYSSGMYVRLAFAVAAHLEPEVLIVDEVLAVGDSLFQKKCLGRMGEMAKTGRTVLFVSHNMSAIAKLCQSVILLDQGRLLKAGKPIDLIAKYLFRETSKTSYDVAPIQHNQGTREAEIQTAMVADADGHPRNEFLMHAPIVLQAVYEAKKDFPRGIAFWVIICTYDGTPLLAAHQNDQEYVPVGRGKHLMRITLRKPFLLPGSYSAMVGIFNHDHTFLDWVDGFQSFKVVPLYSTGKAFDGRWGQVEAEVEWRMEAHDPGIGGREAK